MFRNNYDNDSVTFSPQGRIFQVEYALEAIKQGSAAVGLRSKTHVALVALKRNAEELGSYQKKIIPIDKHLGVALAGLSPDARVLSNFMRQQSMASRLLYKRPVPVARVVNAIADKAQVNTQHYGKRPYGVGLLIAGVDETGPHLWEFQPSGQILEYFGAAIGARSQSARTYLERSFESFPDVSRDELVLHGLKALRDTLQQDRELTTDNTSIAIVGIGEDLKQYDGPKVKRFLDLLGEDGTRSQRAARLDTAMDVGGDADDDDDELAGLLGPGEGASAMDTTE
ncbi:hypothetical protein TWF506_009794 [Arthrobotrys conoides]|uniref:Proteasome subunit alpha type n=1 Tax=Arthrobotrys conoides TaxID=74498 RepID=A0AAN8NJ43_9PEZI